MTSQTIDQSSWAVQDAKARFSEFLDTCLSNGPQIVTRRGTQAAVLLPIEEWHRLQKAARPTLKELLLTDEARGKDLVPPRAPMARRKVKPLA
jgi:antitoxin Phd